MALGDAKITAPHSYLRGQFLDQPFSPSTCSSWATSSPGMEFLSGWWRAFVQRLLALLFGAFSYFSLLVVICQAEHAYRCQDLIKIELRCRVAITSNSRLHNIAEDISHTLGSGWFVFGTKRQQRRWRSKDRKKRRMPSGPTS